MGAGRQDVAASQPARSDTDQARRARDEFTAWVRPHWTPMARLAARLTVDGTSEDVLQEALAAAWRKRDQFDETRGAARSWLLAVVADQALKSRRRRRPVLLTDVLRDAADLARDGLARDDVVPDVDLRAAIARLAPRQRLAVVLHYYVDLPVAEVAEVMACSVGTVKSTLSDARRALRDRLSEGDA